MSYNEKLCGVSYKLDVPKEGRADFLKKAFPKDADTIDKYIEEWGEDWFWEYAYEKWDRKTHNVWQIMSDYKGSLGWVYVMDSGESNGDINFQITLSNMREYVDMFNEAGLVITDEVIDSEKLKAFAIDWYNGGDCPLIF